MTDQKKTPEQNKGDKPIGSTKQSSSVAKKVLKAKKPIYMSVLAMFFLLSLGAGIFFYLQDKNENKYVFTIDGKSYDKSEVEKLTKYPVEVEKKSQSDAARELYELLRTEKAGRNLGVDLTDDAVKDQKQQLYQGVSEADQKKYSEWFNLNAQYKTILQSVSSDEVEGYMYDFYFGQHIQYGPRYKPDGLGESRLISQDKQYAKERADYYHKALSEGTITPDKVLAEVLQDPRLGQGTSAESSFSRQFKSAGESSWQQQLFNSADRIETVQQVKNAEKPSSIKTSKAFAAPDSKNKEDMSFYFAYLTSAPKEGITSNDLSNALSALKSSYRGYRS